MFHSFRIASVVISFLAMGLLAASAQEGPRLPPQLLKSVEAMIGGQISAFRAGNHEEAFGYAAPSIRQIFGSTERFIGMVKNGYGAIYGAQQWSFGRGEVREGDLIQEVMITGPAGKNWVALYTLKKQADGNWRITGVQMKPAELQST